MGAAAEGARPSLVCDPERRKVETCPSRRSSSHVGCQNGGTKRRRQIAETGRNPGATQARGRAISPAASLVRDAADDLGQAIRVFGISGEPEAPPWWLAAVPCLVGNGTRNPAGKTTRFVGGLG